MWEFILTQLVRPIAHRLGTAVGVYLGTLDLLNAEAVATVEAAIIIVAGLAVDLIARRVL